MKAAKSEASPPRKMLNKHTAPFATTRPPARLLEIRKVSRNGVLGSVYRTEMGTLENKQFQIRCNTAMQGAGTKNASQLHRVAAFTYRAGSRDTNGFLVVRRR
jgi:hypothetical protein